MAVDDPSSATTVLDAVLHALTFWNIAPMSGPVMASSMVSCRALSRSARLRTPTSKRYVIFVVYETYDIPLIVEIIRIIIIINSIMHRINDLLSRNISI